MLYSNGAKKLFSQLLTQKQILVIKIVLNVFIRLSTTCYATVETYSIATLAEKIQFTKFLFII